MKQHSIARRYARALFDLGLERENLPQLVDEYSQVLDVIKQQPSLRNVLEHPLVGVEAKKQMAQRIWGDMVSPMLRHLLLLMIEKRREDQIEAVYEAFHDLVDRSLSVAEVKVTTAAPLDEEAQQSLQRVLTDYLGKDIRMMVQQDKSILGGIVVQIGDRRIDGSLRTRLRSLQHAISGRDSS